MQIRTLSDWLGYAELIHPREIDMTLDRVRAVATRMGLLNVSSTRFIIVAGTNGKGSTTLAMEALLLAQGYSVGATVSPHVQRFNERIRLNGAEVGDDELCVAFAAVEQARVDTSLTYFEFATLVALTIFRQHQVDFAVLEVGLGGRLDAFNIVDAEIAVVPSIGLDHQAYLGDDLEQIGREKAGVFRSVQTVVLGAVTDSVRQVAADLNCRIFASGTDFSVIEDAAGWSYHSATLRYEGLPQGALAATNWALAITAIASLQAPEPADLHRVIKQVNLPGRMERWTLEGRSLLLDVAHNPAAAQFVCQRLQLLYGEIRAVGILGMLADKDPCGVVERLSSIVDQWILVPTGGQRGMSSVVLQQRLGEQIAAEPVETIEAAFARALSLTCQGGVILALGSFSVVGQSQNWLQQSREFSATRQESF